MSILHHPYFLPWDRRTAEQFVAESGTPILRPSSIAGHYAATYYCIQRRKIIHTLIRQNTDYSIDVISPEGVVYDHYRTLDEIMTVLRRPPPLLTQIAPALLPLLPAVVARCVEEDPCD